MAIECQCSNKFIYRYQYFNGKKAAENKNEKKPDWRGGFITNGEIEIPNRYVEGILNNDQNSTK